jgi:endonuclease/exonuclease/phosphatase family metal-dependent hydrolase
MKKYLLLLTLFMLAEFQLPAQEPPVALALKVMTFNVRFDNPGDGINAWQHRIPLVEAYMGEVAPDIVGVQESLHHQNTDMLRIMPGYQYIGTGRDDAGQGGEYSPIFFRSDRFELLGHGQFWLSETPDVPGSIGWEAVLPRVVAWARLKDGESGLDLYVFNTHFSHVSDLARRKSMEFISDQIRKIAGDHRVILTGDFNITGGSELYYDMLAHFFRNNRLQNAELMSETPVANARSTFNAFREDVAPRVIDYIFVSDHFRVDACQVDRFRQDGVFISDHWPVWARVVLVD